MRKLIKTNIFRSVVSVNEAAILKTTINTNCSFSYSNRYDNACDLTALPQVSIFVQNTHPDHTSSSLTLLTDIITRIDYLSTAIDKCETFMILHVLSRCLFHVREICAIPHCVIHLIRTVSLMVFSSLCLLLTDIIRAVVCLRLLERTQSEN